MQIYHDSNIRVWKYGRFVQNGKDFMILFLDFALVSVLEA